MYKSFHHYTLKNLKLAKIGSQVDQNSDDYPQIACGNGFLFNRMESEEADHMIHAWI